LNIVDITFLLLCWTAEVLLSTDTQVDIAYSPMFGTCFRHVDRDVGDATASMSTFALDNVMLFRPEVDKVRRASFRRVNIAYTEFI